MKPQPPFCPNRYCSCHWLDRSPELAEGTWFVKDGTYSPDSVGRTQRYRCRSCGTRFSDQTFRLDFAVKLPLDYPTLFNHQISGSGIRDLARIQGVTDKVILNRISRLARQSIALHARMRAYLTLDEDLVADGFESFTWSQYFPNNIHMLVGKQSQYLYGADYANLRRKGRMRERQKRRRAELEKRFLPLPGEVLRSFTRLLGQLRRYAEKMTRSQLCLYTDEKQEYRRALGADSVELPEGGRLIHIRRSSKVARTRHNDLFAVNYYDRELRKDQANHVRESVQFSREVNNCMERLWVYSAWHNYRKPYRIGGRGGKERTHAQVAGVKKKQVEGLWEGFFYRRAFYSHLVLTESEQLAWFRAFRSPMQECSLPTLQYIAA